MKKLLCRTLSRTLIPSITRKYEKKFGNYVVCFHGVNKKNYNLNRGAQVDLLVSQFIDIVSWLENRFHFISPNQLFDQRTKGGVLLTFDDGLLNNYYNVMPYLESRKIPALYFLSTGPILKKTNPLWFIKKRIYAHYNHGIVTNQVIYNDLYSFMNEKQINSASHEFSFVYFGAHTVTHPDLIYCKPERIYDELYQSKMDVENMTNKPCQFFAYPRGLINSQVKRVAKTIFKASFAVDNYDDRDNYMIPRVSLHQSDFHYLDLKFSLFHKRNFKGE
ncbi:polysaccharide deacetylase family protein [Verrucomicrobia bacterium]|nr:polysaccharide deacetylase family protein [Verrucomicrobiota bacterium]